MAELPTGTVTFLFTDIEGSTTRWEHHAEAMRVALARHDTLLRAAIEEHGGHVVKTMGDAFHAAFSRAPDGVAATLDGQRRLQAEPWEQIAPEIGALRVRMALHTGAAEERDGDYYGPELNRAARLLSTGHGGQILLSDVTAGLVRDTLPADLSLLDLGEHRLKDLIRPERVFQVVAPDLPTEFPPLRSLDARPNNLPIHPTALLGRDREVAEVSALLRGDTRLVTLTGPGGTGKTRLSFQVAAELLEDFEQGAFFVELAPISDPALIPTTIAQALGVREAGGRPVLEALKEYLRSRSLLLVLDNFEQIVAGSSVVSELLAASPGLKALVSSREPLQVRGEHEYAVPPLDLPDLRQSALPHAVLASPAVALFVQRARAVRAGFEVTDENALAIAEICTRLDGLPLAIELAAARVRLLPPRALAQRLERRLALLVGGARDLPTRQQTLRDTIAWSHDLLDEDERRLFRSLAVFVSGWTLDAAEAVCNPDGDLDVLTGLESLVSKSLVRSDEMDADEPRFRMLETIREFALERLDESGETATLRRRHCEAFLTLASQAAPRLRRADAGAWFGRLEADHDNFRAALAWSAERDAGTDQMCRLAGPLWSFWWMRGHFVEGRSWLDQALIRATDEAARIVALEGASILAFFQDDLGRADVLLEEMAALARATRDDAALVTALAWYGYTARNRSDFVLAEARCSEAVALGRQIRDLGPLALSLMMLGKVATGQADFSRGAAVLAEGLQVARRADDAGLWVPHILHDLSRAVPGLGDLDQALAYAVECRDLFLRRDDTWGLAVCNRLLMRLARLRGDAAQGIMLARNSLIFNRDLGAPGMIIQDLDVLGWIARANGDYIRAVHLLAAATAVRDAIGRTMLAEARKERDEDLTIAREALGEDTFDTVWAEGMTMSLEQAIAYALEETSPS